jgi:hypothetical protein
MGQTGTPFRFRYPYPIRKMKKMNISTEKTVTLIFFQSKLGDLPGGQGTGEKNKVREGGGFISTNKQPDRLFSIYPLEGHAVSHF